MNILYLCDEYPTGRHGGIGTAVQLLAREMHQQGHSVVVAGFYDWGYGGEDEFEDNGVKVYRFRRKLDSSWFHKKDSLRVRATYKLLYKAGILEWDIKTSLKKYKTFLETIIAKHDIQIIEAPDFNEYVQYCHGIVYFPELSKPVIRKLHGTITYFLEEAGKPVPTNIRAMESDALQKAEGVISVSEYTARKTAHYFNYKKPITVLYNGIQTDIEVNAPKATNQVIFTGSLVEKKGIYQLIKGWNIVNKELPDAVLHIYGKGPVEKLKPYISATASGSIHFRGHIPREELYRELASANVGIFPSYAETFALAPMEAMLCKTAVIHTNRTTGPEFIQHGINGLIVDPDNVEELAEKILFLLKNPEEARKLAEAGRESIKTRFDIRLIAKNHTSFYKSILKQ